MPRRGLTREQVVEAATELADAGGLQALTLAALAGRLGVRPPSLSHHVDGIEALERAVGLVGVDLLASECGMAAMGRSGCDALVAVARAYRDVARRHPGAYRLAQTAHPGDPEWTDRSAAVLGPVLAVLAGYGLTGDRAIHAARTMRSALHGFALLELEAGFGIDLPLDESFEFLLDVLHRGLSGCALDSPEP
jgi:AcrR family transcriptional regulator